MKILVLGVLGRPGHKMFQVLRERFPNTMGTIPGSVNDGDLAAVSLLEDNHILDHVDAQNFPAQATLLRRLEPDVIVNCIGVIKQRAAAKDSLPSITINARWPHRFVEVCSEWCGRWLRPLVMVTTDFPLTVVKNVTGIGASARGKVGDGARELIISSISGNLSLLKN